MSIAATDLKFVAADAAGNMGTTVVQDGASNNLFPDVMPTDRVAGKVETRRCYAAVLSASNAEPLSNVKVGIASAPTDPSVDVVLTPAGGWPSADSGYVAAGIGRVSGVMGSTELTVLDGPAATTIPAGTAVDLRYDELDAGSQRAVPGFVTVAAPDKFLLNEPLTESFGSGSFGHFVANIAGISYYSYDWTVSGVAGSRELHILAGPAASDPSSYSTPSRLIYHAPIPRTQRVMLTPTSATKFQCSPAALKSFTGGTYGRLRRDTSVPRPRGTAVATSAAAAAGASSMALVSVGKITDPRFFEGDVVDVIHSDGVTYETATIAQVNYASPGVTFTGPLSRAYPAGSTVSLLLSGLGVAQAAVTLQPFALQTWTRAWTDALPAGALPPSVAYSGTPEVVSAGAITERWALVFRSPTVFDLVGERLGTIASGNVGSDFAPLNPMTNTPYFTLRSALWGTGAMPGNAVRFNTKAASVAVDVHRSVAAGSTASGTTGVKLLIVGDAGV